MEDSGLKGLQIAIGLFVSMFVVASFILSITKIIDIYKVTNTVKVDLLHVDSEEELYSNDEILYYGIDVANVYRKYKNDKMVEVHLRVGVKMSSEDDVNFEDSGFMPVIIDCNNILEPTNEPLKYKYEYSKPQYKNKTIILFEK